MPYNQPPFTDAEQIPPGLVRELFLTPPELNLPPIRHALVIGPRGVGKTMLLRYLNEVHKGIAVYLSLPELFESLSKETSQGGLGAPKPSADVGLVEAKATSLLTVSLAGAFATVAKCSVSSELINDNLPDHFAATDELVDAAWLTATRKDLGNALLADFDNLHSRQNMVAFAIQLGAEALRRVGPLVILLDKADMVPPPSLGAAFELLTQTGTYTALIAMRPGLPLDPPISGDTAPVVGDQYDLINLGTHPRSDAWLTFTRNAVTTQLPEADSIPQGQWDTILSVSRESVRHAVILASRIATHGGGVESLNAALEDVCANLLQANNDTLKRYGDFRRVVGEIRRLAYTRKGGLTGPMEVTIAEPGQLFPGREELHRFVGIALRYGGFCMPEGERWSPGLRPTSVEIAPPLLWQKNRGWWLLKEARPVRLKMSLEEMLRPPPRVPASPRVFVAFRMGHAASRGFRAAIEKELMGLPALADKKIQVTDGAIPYGERWPREIRKRLDRSKLVIADVTGMRREVVFELGFAFGRRRLVIPVVERKSDLDHIPWWLSEAQIATFETHDDLSAIARTAGNVLTIPGAASLPTLAQPQHGRAVWLRPLEWNQHQVDQARRRLEAENIELEVLALQDDAEPPSGLSPGVKVALDAEVIDAATSSLMLFASLNGTTADSLIHYLAGAVAARPTAFSGTFRRRVRILEEPGAPAGTYTADSLRRCEATVRVVPLKAVRGEAEGFATEYLAGLDRIKRRK